MMKNTVKRAYQLKESQKTFVVYDEFSVKNDNYY